MMKIQATISATDIGKNASFAEMAEIVRCFRTAKDIQPADKEGEWSDLFSAILTFQVYLDEQKILELSQNLPHNVMVLVHRGEIIPAVKELRASSDPVPSLKEAKDIVDRYADTVLAERQFAFFYTENPTAVKNVNGLALYQELHSGARGTLLRLEIGQPFNDFTSPPIPADQKAITITRLLDSV